MISVKDSKELTAAVLALKAANKSLVSDINKATREVLAPIWKDAVQRNAATVQDAAVIAKGVRIKAGNPAVAMAATSSKKLSGGLVPNRDWPVIEFGSERIKRTTYQRKGHEVTRHTQHGLPRRYKPGRVAYQAFAEVAPRMVSLWVQLIVRKYRDAAEGK